MTLNGTDKCGLEMIYTCNALESVGCVNIGNYRYRLGVLMGNEMATLKEKIDAVVPVPNSGLYYGMGLAAAINVPYVQALVKDKESVRTFFEEDSEKRIRLIENGIKVIPELVKDKSVIIVDEAVFTGNTLKSACRKLRECGAAAIHIRIPTSLCARQCPFGLRPEKYLLACRLSTKEMPEWFGADSIEFLSYGKMFEYSNKYQSVCLRCFEPVNASTIDLNQTP